MSVDERWWEPAFRSVIEGRRIILCTATVAGGARLARAVRVFDPADVLVYAMAPGEVPDDVRVFAVDPPTGDSFAEIGAHWKQQMTDPSERAIEAFDEFDPDRSAVVLRLLAAEPRDLAGRPVLAFRPDSWVALEDKTVIDAFWDRHGVAHQPSTVVPLVDAPGVSPQFDIGNGVVWAADATQGEHAGGDLSKWVRSADDFATVTAELQERCKDVRVMPFVEGIPCSIHGIVLPDGVAVLRPVEMVTLRNESRFVYFGSSTFWDPPPHIRDQMSTMAREVGKGLADEVDFRGAFSLDGVAAADGFWPTEVNPRVGGGLVAMTNADTAPPVMIFELIVAGVDIGASVEQFEQRILSIADTDRSGVLNSTSTPSRTETIRVSLADGTWQITTDEQYDAELSASPAGVMARLTPTALPVGASAAPLAAAFAEFCDLHLGTSNGPLTPAPDPFG